MTEEEWRRIAMSGGHTSGRRYCRRCRANAYQAKKAA